MIGNIIMSVRKIPMQYIGVRLKNILQPMERDVKIVELDGKEFVPERTCHMEYDPVHQDIVCSNCGTAFYDGTVTIVIRSEPHMLHNINFKNCPVCGAKVQNM